MKSQELIGMMNHLVLLTALAVPVGLTAQDQADHAGQPSHYILKDLGTFGGTSSSGNGLNNRGLVTGGANLKGDLIQHAAAWLNGYGFDLGTLGGPNSGILFPVKSDNGEIVGASETGATDPLGEDWSCSAFFPTVTGHICVGFLWKDGAMKPLPTLGGSNGVASGINNHGQAVGWAENTVHDPTCAGRHQVLQFEAVIWGPAPGQIQQLPPYPGDVDTAAVAINDHGDVVGISGICDQAVGRFTARHAVLWQNGSVTNIGNFGGVAWNTPVAINKQGDIVGFSDFPGDGDGKPNFHAFLKTKGRPIQDLGTLNGDKLSEALGINERGQIVGVSIDANGNQRAFIWQDNKMTDLNSLIPIGSLSLLAAGDINDRGEITGQACVLSNGACVSGVSTTPVFLAIPRVDRDGDEAASSSAQPLQ